MSEPGLQEHVSVLSAALESLDDAVVIKDANLVVRYANPAARRQVGNPPGSIVGLRAGDLFDPATAARMEADDRRVLETGRALHASQPATPNGMHAPACLPACYRKAPILQDGRCIGIISVVPAAALPVGSVPSAVILDRYFRQSILAIACLDRALRFIWVNETYARTGRRPREAFVGRGHFDLYPDAENEALFRRVLETGQPFQQAARPFHHPDQPERPVTYWDLGLQPIRDEADQIDGLILTLIDVTERQVALDQAARFSDRLSLATGIAGIGVWEYHPKDQTLIWDQNMFDLYGASPETFAGSLESWSDALHPDDRERALAEVTDAITGTGTGTGPFDTSFRIVRPCGAVRHMRAFAEIFAANAGAPRRVIGVNYDITDRTEPLERLEKISRNVPGMIYQYRLDSNGRSCFPYASEGIRHLYGVAPETVADDASPVFAILHPEDRQEVRDGMDESARSLRLWACDYRVNHPTRGELWLSGRSVPERQPDGSTVWHGFTSDVTARRRQEDRLRQLSEAVEQSPVSVMIADLDGAIQYANKKFCEITGYAAHEVLGRNPRFLKSGRTPPEEYARLWATVLAGGTWTGEFQNRRKDGSHYWESAVISPIRDARGDIRTLLAVKEDITHRKSMEDDLRRSNAELEQFAYVASHDLRQPLRMINSFTGLIEKTLADSLDDDTREMMDFVRDGARHMDNMLVSLLEYSRVGRVGEPMAEHDSRALAEAALSHLMIDVEEAGATVRFDGDWPTVMVSGSEFLRLFENLIGNALKYRAPGHAPEVTLWSGSDGESAWSFAVRDNGIGIEPVHTDRVFKMFQRLHTREAYDGTGIGLSICRKIVERHGGRIWIESAGADRGTAVQFTLPRAGKAHTPD